MLNFLRKSKGVLGINARNLKYITPHNPRRAIRIADNKLETKRVLKKFNIPTPETYAVIKDRHELNQFNWDELPKTFALKPNRGLGGEGIMILYGKIKNKDKVWVKADKERVGVEQLKDHALNILEGSFSLAGIPDIAFFEERVKLPKFIKPYCHRGIPDIRIIVYNNIPIIAELRLPTTHSKGRANLHSGGIGVGIDMGTGVTTSAIQNNKLISYIPDTRIPLSGIKIHHWKDILNLAIETQIASKIGFLGVDIAIDRDKGPLVLELNARSGLAIQIANMTPLRNRLETVERLKIKNIEQGVRMAQELFGGDVEEELEEISGRRVIGINEPIKILGNESQKYVTLAKIDTGAYRTSICSSLAEKLGPFKVIKYKKVKGALGGEERQVIDLSFVLDKRRVDTEAFVADRSQMKYDIIIGRKDLKRFLIDPSKNVLVKRDKIEEVKKQLNQ